MAQLDIILLICFNILVLKDTSTAEKLWFNNNNPRHLPFPMGLGNKIQIITGVGVPIEVSGQSISLGLILKSNYELPTNVSIYTEVEDNFRRMSPPTRWQLYETFEAALDRFTMGGRSCLLQSICKAAEASLNHSGILGEILHLLLMPSSSTEEISGHPDYYRAEMNGKLGLKRCEEMYPECPNDILDVITSTHY
ncbi:uncharacterized protein LOC111055031 isoform X2 [Nilaparvata lugens]|uniref:uncharacterized protein LOC111055031 isoform X2 n=1 Tax=Nilaparvata lugens TaxID=108931 RepID=UPI00193CF8E5|nr:uncharacterized protein LOC111055031 isoform X2 [Nilaparvata lugens]